MNRNSEVQQVTVKCKLLSRWVHRIEPCQPNKGREAFSGWKRGGDVFVLNKRGSFSYLRFLPVLMLLMCWGSLSNAQNSSRNRAGPADNKAYFTAENTEYIQNNGDIISSDLRYKAYHHAHSSFDNQIDSPNWLRVSSPWPVYNGGYSYRVVSPVGNGRNEQIYMEGFNSADGARWFAFSIYIDPSTTVNTQVGHFFFAQVGQISPAGPYAPLNLGWTGTSWELVVRGDNGIRGNRLRTVLASGPMPKGQWHEFKVKVKPGIRGAGEVALWKKESNRWSSQPLNWGATPINSLGYQYDSAGNLRDFTGYYFTMGIYRGSYTTQSVVYVDNLRYGKTESDLENAPNPPEQKKEEDEPNKNNNKNNNKK